MAVALIAAKVEGIYGTYAAPAEATDMLESMTYNVVPFVSQTVRRAVDRGFAGRTPSKPTAVHSRHTFTIDLCGSGSPGTPPFWMRVLRAAMFAAPAPEANRVTQALTSVDDGGSVSLVGWRGKNRHRGKGARGNAKFVFPEKALPRLEFDLLALIEGAAPADAVPPVGVVFPAFAPDGSVEVSLDNTSIAIGGFTLNCQSMEIDLGMKTTLFSGTARRAIVFDKAEDGDRRSITWSASFELPDPELKEYFTPLVGGSPQALALTHGKVAGNIIEMTSAGAVIEEITYTEVTGRLFAQARGGLVPTAANNELMLITR